MKIQNPNRILDELLENFVDFDGETHRSTATFQMMYQNLDKQVVIEALEKLTKDRYLHSTPNKEHFDHNFYRLTFEGRVFYQDGGYRGQHQRENLNRISIKTLNWSIGISGSVATVYYLIEIIKHFL